MLAFFFFLTLPLKACEKGERKSSVLKEMQRYQSLVFAGLTVHLTSTANAFYSKRMM